MRVDKYIARDGSELTEGQWDELRKDREHTNIREFANKQFHIKAIWWGRLDFYAKTPEEVKRRWLPFRLTILESKLGEVRLRERDSGDYASESALINAYEDFLVRHNLGYWAPSGAEPGSFHFVEVGNLARGTTKDAPALIGDDAMEEAGSW